MSQAQTAAAADPGTAAVGSEQTGDQVQARVTAIRITLTLAAWVGVGVLLWWYLGPNGYNTSDYGFIVGQAWRVLHGEMPHVDFISARPAGSAYLHTLDFLLPLPLVDSSRLVALVMVVAVGVLAGVTVLGRAPWRWTWTANLVVASVVLIGLNTFQIGPWYTTDGLVFTLWSFALLRLWDVRGSTRVPTVALLLGGCAPLFKQSFFLTVPLAVAWALFGLWRRGRLTWRSGIASTVLAGVPGGLYVLWVALHGGLDEMVAQLSSATEPNWMGTLGSGSLLLPPMLEAVLACGVLAALLYLWFTRPSVPARDSAVRLTVRTTVSALAFLATLALTWAPHLLMIESRWSTRLFWLAALGTLVAGSTQRRIRLGDAAILAAAWMTILSWGMPWPLLAGGSMVMVIAHLLAEPTGDPLSQRGLPMPIAAVWLVASVVGLLGTGLVLNDAIDNRLIHRDLPARSLTTPLRPLDPDFGRTMTNPTTAKFLSDAIQCVRDHPADGVVFGSWNSDLYAILGLRNPLATDGSNYFEITGAEEQFRDSVRALAARGDFLVLFPLVNPETLTIPLEQLPVATTETPIPEYWFTQAVPYAWMAEQLGGERVACGSWVGLYAPPTAAAS